MVLRSGSVHLDLRRDAVPEEAVLRRCDSARRRGIASAAATIVIVIVVAVVIIIIIIVVVIVIIVIIVVIVACENERHRLRSVIEKRGGGPKDAV
jgi:Flp pilus assembly protein TadB